ncbi:periplasmic heavy metal sensor [Wenzhouxiangella limi]|uniref:Signaling pathway modulator ZraP n=1 Tax=Wenzhouxiangella limi TaxID=2707351 RepID=A0A845V0F9_9GAMM|nr:periplasmic heavy metal sensor [Wenzhouxiangella limi]NDY94776.1 periplasmic heavy metal sensor [Wenzhouxiangella limi]
MKTQTPVLSKLTLALALVGSLAITSNALAQGHPDPVPRLSERLSLTTEQETEIQALYQAHRRDKREQGRENRAERRQARVMLREEIRALLDDEQAQKFDAMAQRGAQGRRGGRRDRMDERGGGRGKHRPDGNS